MSVAGPLPQGSEAGQAVAGQMGPGAPAGVVALQNPAAAAAAAAAAAGDLSKNQPKRLHVSNIPFRFRDPDLRAMFGVSFISYFVLIQVSPLPVI